MLWPAANLIAFAAIPQVRRRERRREKSFFFFFFSRCRVGVVVFFLFFNLSFLSPPKHLSSLSPTPTHPSPQDLRILYSTAVGVAWCAYVSLSLAASAAATGGSLPPPPPPFDAPLE